MTADVPMIIKKWNGRASRDSYQGVFVCLCVFGVKEAKSPFQTVAALVLIISLVW